MSKKRTAPIPISPARSRERTRTGTAPVEAHRGVYSDIETYRLNWITDTPIINYRMVAEDGNREGGPDQEIDLTREEYESLKRRLAEIRGLLPSAKAA